MDSKAAEGSRLKAALAVLAEARALWDQTIGEILTEARELNARDRVEVADLLDACEAAGLLEQAVHGQLILLLGQADRLKAAPSGMKPWIATHLNISDGKARGMAESARKIGAIPALAAPLASGEIGAETVGILSRTAKAVSRTSRDTVTAVTEMLESARTEGVTAARRKVKVLEHTLDPDSSKEVLVRQRAQSFLEINDIGDGFCRIEAVLDPIRATTLREAIHAQTADWIRRAQYDHEQPLPEYVQYTDQINAHALVRIAEVFLKAPPEVRDAKFNLPMLFSASATPSEDEPLARSTYGDMVPREALPQPGDPGTHVIEFDENDELVKLDGVEINTEPTARLASRAQRIALEHRDKHCTHPGCTIPPPYGLHAHHEIPYSQGGLTTTDNMAMICSTHHTEIHKQQKREPK